MRKDRGMCSVNLFLSIHVHVLLTKCVCVCVCVSVSGDPHSFHLSDLQLASAKADHINCPGHGGRVSLEQLVQYIYTWSSLL